MSISPLAALNAVGAARALIHDLVSIPRMIRSQPTKPTAPTHYALRPSNSPTHQIPVHSGATSVVGSSPTYGLSETHGVTKIQTNVDAFAAELGKVFAEHGIDTSTEVLLRTDATGRVVVANDHPDAAHIQEVFENDPALAKRFQQLSTAMQTLHNLQTGAMPGTNQFHLAISNEGGRLFYGPESF